MGIYISETYEPAVSISICIQVEAFKGKEIFNFFPEPLVPFILIW
jgi:hypothetical protein